MDKSIIVRRADEVLEEEKDAGNEDSHHRFWNCCRRNAAHLAREVIRLRDILEEMARARNPGIEEFPLDPKTLKSKHGDAVELGKLKGIYLVGVKAHRALDGT